MDSQIHNRVVASFILIKRSTRTAQGSVKVSRKSCIRLINRETRERPDRGVRTLLNSVERVRTWIFIESPNEHGPFVIIDTGTRPLVAPQRHYTYFDVVLAKRREKGTSSTCLRSLLFEGYYLFRLELSTIVPATHCNIQVPRMNTYDRFRN